MREGRLKQPFHSRVWLRVEKLRRKAFLKKHFLRLFLKGLSASSHLPQGQRWLITQKKAYLKRSYSVTHLRDRCVRTGRARFVLGATGLSRLPMKVIMGRGLWASWQR